MSLIQLFCSSIVYLKQLAMNVVIICGCSVANKCTIQITIMQRELNIFPHDHLVVMATAEWVVIMGKRAEAVL